MNDYEKKQEEKRKRCLELSERFLRESKSRAADAAYIQSFIPFGQPILVGHHSEKRHRRDLKRVDDNIRKSMELKEKAEYYKRKAENIGKGGISQDDPDVTKKLRHKLKALGSSQQWMKDVNKAWKKHGKPKPEETEKWGLIAKELDCAFVDLAVAKENLNPIYYQDKPFPSYSLQNNNGNMKSIRDRIKEMEQRQKDQDEGNILNLKGTGFEIIESYEENRIMITFDERPTKEICQHLRRDGWRWSPTRNAWLRYINNQGKWKAKRVFEYLKDNL